MKPGASVKNTQHQNRQRKGLHSLLHVSARA
jgi:hypothetical protein